MKRICEMSKWIYQDGRNYGRNPQGHIDQDPKKAGCLEHRQREAGYSSKGGGGGVSLYIIWTQSTGISMNLWPAAVYKITAVIHWSLLWWVKIKVFFSLGPQTPMW